MVSSGDPPETHLLRLIGYLDCISSERKPYRPLEYQTLPGDW